MPIDAYEPCPCGSGKKFKFCCAAAAEEIDKVLKYQEKHQIQSSLQVLDRLLTTKADLPWGYITKASILLNEGEYGGARETLVLLLEKKPDHPFGIALYATAAFASVGYERAKPAIYRAYQRCSKYFPDVVGSMSMGIAAWMFSTNKFMACRQHLAQAMRLVPDEDKQDIFLRLLEFDSNSEVPYPLRSVHPLSPWQPPEEVEPAQKEELQKLVHRAESLVAIGCFEPAADTYRQLAERNPDNANLWQNAALCTAWDGDEALAAEKLHKAARIHQDPDAAVECETLAQLLDLNQPENQLHLSAVNYRVRSVGRLLTLLDEHERFIRVPPPPQAAGEDGEKTVSFRILDRTPLPEDPNLWPELDAIPHVVGRVDVLEEVDRESPNAVVSGLDSEIAAGRELFEGVAAEVIESTEEETEKLTVFAAVEQAPLLFSWEFPQKTPLVRQNLSEQRRWDLNVQEIWPNLPLKGLGGKTPNEARGDASLEIPLKAAIFVLDAFCDRHGYLIDIPAMCQNYKVAPPTPIETRPDLPLQSFSAMQLHRLKISELSDDQLIYVLNRVLLIHHSRVLHDVLMEALSRPSCREQVDLERTYQTLMDLSRDRCDRDETYHWISEGQKHAQTLENAFEKTLRWEMRELSFRAEDPGDPNLIPLAYKLVRKYGKKVPQLTEFVTTVLTTYGIEPPADLAEMADEAGTVSSGGIWTPGGQAEASGEKKIWLPGQS